MDKIWFIIVDGKEEGPFSIDDLKRHPFFTPDTLTRKTDSKRWVQARFIGELAKAFEDQPASSEDDDEETEFKAPIPCDEIALDLGNEPPQFFIWLILALSLLILILIRLFHS